MPLLYSYSERYRLYTVTDVVLITHYRFRVAITVLHYTGNQLLASSIGKHMWSQIVQRFVSSEVTLKLAHHFFEKPSSRSLCGSGDMRR